jgi:hypothetical protein
MNLVLADESVPTLSLARRSSNLGSSGEMTFKEKKI